MSKPIIRIKRSLKEDPINALVLNCKKRKLDCSSTADATDTSTLEFDHLSTIFEFAGTVENANDIFQHVKSSRKNDAEQKYRKNQPTLLDKLRTEQQISSKSNRFKIVNHFRSLNPSEEASNPSIDCTIVDVITNESESKESTSDVPEEYSKEFVYDYYYTDSDSMYDEALYNYMSVCPLSNDSVVDFETYNDNASESSIDSNAENYFANDYPDESDVESYSQDCSDTEEGLLKAMHKASLRRELSTDDDDEAVYGSPSDVALDHSYYEEYDRSCTP